MFICTYYNSSSLLGELIEIENSFDDYLDM